MGLIPKICKRGTSFKFSAKYLLTDQATGLPREGAKLLGLYNFMAETAQNADEAALIMAHTYQWRDTIKRLAGKGGGTSNSPPVWHGVVNFDPSETPTEDEMRTAALGLLDAVGLGSGAGYQFYVVGHFDQRHPHAHVIVNLIHPETGLAANPAHEYPKAQKWAAKWEKERGQNFCKDRAAKHEAIENGDPIPKMDKKKWLSKAEWLAQQGLTNDNKSPARQEFEALRDKNRAEASAMFQAHLNAGKERAAQRNALWEAYQAERQSIQDSMYQKRKAAWGRRADKVILPLSQRAFQDWLENRAWDKLSRKLWKQKQAWRQRERGFLGRIYNAVAAASCAEKGKRGGAFFWAAMDKGLRDAALMEMQAEARKTLSGTLRNNRKFDFSMIELEKNFALQAAAARYKAASEALRYADKQQKVHEGILRGNLKQQHKAAYDAWRTKYNIPERTMPGVAGADNARTTSSPHIKAGILIEHGWAHYNFDREEKKNYYARYRDQSGQEHITWGIDLERAIPESGAAAGDYVTFHNRGNQIVNVQIPLKDNSGRIYDYENKQARRNVWEVEIGRPAQDNTKQPPRQKGNNGPRSDFNAAAVIDAATEEKTRHAAQKRKERMDKAQTQPGWKARSKTRKPRDRQRNKDIT